MYYHNYKKLEVDNMSIKGNKAIDKMAETILKYINKSIDSAKVNRTAKGRIIELLGDNKYKVIINGGEYTVRSHWTHKVNDVVVIVVCNNDWGQLYVLY